MTQPANPHATSKTTLSILLAGLATLGPFSIDTYLPSFGTIEQSLHATPLELQQTLSVYLLCFAIMMLFHGSLSDAYGRRPVILVSLTGFIVTSLFAASATSIHMLIVMRGLQGLFAGAGMIVGRAIVRDLYAGPDAQKIMSRITMMFGLSPAVAPIIGGWLHDLFGWQSVFFFMAGLGALLLAACLRFLPETHGHQHRSLFSALPLIRSYHAVVRHPQFLLLAGTVALNFAGFFLYIAAAPVFLPQTLRLAPDQFARLFIPAITGVILGAWLSGRLAGRVNPERTIQLAYLVLFSAALINLIYNFSTQPTWPWAVLPLTLYSTGMSLAMPSATLLALDLFPQQRGLVSSMQGFVQTFLNALVAGAIAPALAGHPRWLATGMLCFLLGGRLLWQRYRNLPAHHPA